MSQSDLPLEHTDLPLSLERIIDVRSPPSAPKGIDWELLGEKDMREMPVLRELQEAV